MLNVENYAEKDTQNLTLRWICFLYSVATDITPRRGPELVHHMRLQVHCALKPGYMKLLTYV